MNKDRFKCSKNLSDIVEEAKNITTYSSIEWGSAVWDITLDEARNAHNRVRLALFFIRQRKTRSEPAIPLEQPFSDFAKAFIKLRGSKKGVKYSNQKQMLLSLRLLYESLLSTGSIDPSTLTRKHFYLAIEHGKLYYQISTLYNIARSLSEVSEWLDCYSICFTKIGFKNPIPKPPRGDSLDWQAQEKGLEKLPSIYALEVLADISSNPLDDNERILLRIVDLLVVGGFRIGEALTVPLDCWVEEPIIEKNKSKNTNNKNEKRFGIRYWPEKGGQPIVKWLPNIAVALAKRAIDDLTQLCASARKVAAKLEANPHRVILSEELEPTSLISSKQLTKILKLKL